MQGVRTLTAWDVTARASGLAALLCLVSTPVLAINVTSEKLTANIDTTLSIGVASRVEDRAPEHVSISSGGHAFSGNFDDGNLNYDKGVFSSVVKATVEADVRMGDLGIFARAFAFHDEENEGKDRERLPLSDEALTLVGSNVELLDAYASFDTQIGDMPLSLRAGDQVVSWGESTFIPNGINVINPVDVAKLRTPGAELRHAFLPVTMIHASLGVSEAVTVEGFYQLDWEQIRTDPRGSYFSTNGIISKGGDTVYLGSGSVPDVTVGPTGELIPFPAGTGIGGPTGVAVPRAHDVYPDNGGQFGLALRWFTEAAEVGVYYVNYHSRLPLISARTGSLTGLFGGDYAASARYFVEYPEDIQLFGVSFNTDLGDTGISLQGEVSHRWDVPLQVDDAELLVAALTPLDPMLAGLTQLGGYTFDEQITGYKRFEVTQAQATVTKAFGPGLLGADQWVLVAEAAATFICDMPKSDELRLEGPGTYSSGNPLGAPAGLFPVHQTNGFGEDFSMGYRVLARFDFNNAIGAVNLSPRVAFAHDVVGTTPLPLGNFVEGRKALTLGLGATYQNSWNLDASYTTYFGAEEFNQIHDRDFVSITATYAF